MKTQDITTNPIETAEEAGLIYVSDTMPGITRQKHGKHFTYQDTIGETITDTTTLHRIQSLGIPPAYTHIWICPLPNGHLQATGIDARGRKQYRYHPRWREVRDETKYTRMIAFGEVLPKIRKQLETDSKLPGFPKEKVLATIVQLLEKTLIRVGNEEYVKENHSYGLTTLKNKHLEVHGKEVTFKFKGKSNKFHTITLYDPRIAKTVKKLQDLPGQDLFQYVAETGHIQAIGSADVNTYLKQISGQDITAKDFRTWNGTVYAACALAQGEPASTKKELKKRMSETVKVVAERLGNTPAICRKCYIHPTVFSRYTEGKLHFTLSPSQPHSYFLPEEKAVLRFLKENLQK